MELNVTHTSIREREESEGTKIVEEEEDQDVVHEISITKFAAQTWRKEQVEGGKNREKNRNDGDSLGNDKNLEKTTWGFFTMTTFPHERVLDWSPIHFPICNQ